MPLALMIGELARKGDEKSPARLFLDYRGLIFTLDLTELAMKHCS